EGIAPDVRDGGWDRVGSPSPRRVLNEHGSRLIKQYAIGAAIAGVQGINSDGSKTCAVTERPLAEISESAAYQHIGQAGTLQECIVADSAHAVRQNDLG